MIHVIVKYVEVGAVNISFYGSRIKKRSYRIFEVTILYFNVIATCG